MSSSSAAARAGIGKSSKKRAAATAAATAAAAAAKREQEELRLKAFENAKMPDFEPYVHVDVPMGWRNDKYKFLVAARIGCIPPDYVARMTAWMLAHLSPLIKRVPTPQEIEAANGINIMDLFLRFTLRPLGVFDNQESAHEFAKEANKVLNCTVQLLAFYGDNVVPPYTTTGVIHRDAEVQKFMAQFRKHEKAERVEFEQHVVDTYKEMQTLSAKSQEASRQVAKLESGAAFKAPTIHQMPKGDSGYLCEDPNVEKKRLADLEEAEEGDKDWFKRALLDAEVGPLAKMRELLMTFEGFIEGFKYKRDAIDKHVALLTKKVAKARTWIEAGGNDFSELAVVTADSVADAEDDDDDEAEVEAETAPKKTQIKRFIESPDGTLYIVTLQDTATPIPKEDKDKYEVSDPTAPATTRATDLVNREVWYDADHPLPRKMTRAERMAAAEAAGEKLFEGGDAEAEMLGSGGFAQMQSDLEIHNAKMRALRAAEAEKLAAEKASRAGEEYM